MNVELNKAAKRKLIAVKLGNSFFMADEDEAVLYQVSGRAVGVVSSHYRDLEHLLSLFPDAEAVFEGDSMTLTF